MNCWPQLFDELEQDAVAFDFFQALRLIECAHSGRHLLGESARLSDDPIRLGQLPSLGFPPSELQNFTIDKENPDRSLLQVSFFGVFGANGPLPHHLTECAREHPALSRFADIFHHRLLCFFYRAWANTQPALGLDRLRGEQTGPDQRSGRFAGYLGSLVGLGLNSHRERDAMPDIAKLHYASCFVHQTRHREGLREMLADFLGVPVAIEELIGHWMTIPDEVIWKIGETGGAVGVEIGILGETSTIGNWVWNCQDRFRIRLGPFDFATFRRFLPGGLEHDQLVAATRSYAGDGLSWELCLVLHPNAFNDPTSDTSTGTQCDETPWLELGNGSHLGESSWLLSDDPFDRPVDDYRIVFGLVGDSPLDSPKVGDEPA
jgi:type VI secretion system protein ImpH